MSKNLYIVHCIDAEGPLYESTEATFERLNNILGVNLEPSIETLHKIQMGNYPLNGKEEIARKIFSPELFDYNENWEKLDLMLDELSSSTFRMKYKDTMGNGWRYNWFAVDHVGFDINPRRRDIGYHNIFDHYSNFLKQKYCESDEIHWHFHPMSTYREAHICATSFLRSPHLLEILCRRIIDRKWFPSCFRAGFHAERPDSHWFLEQWIPFDFSNQAMKYTDLEKGQIDIDEGRFGDWRRAPSDWSFYHPSHDDYQIPGDCNRVIFRCLNIGTRLRLLDAAEIERAFSRANSGLPTVLAFTNHDFRDMRQDIDQIHTILSKTAGRFPEVQWQHSGAKKAAQSVLGYAVNKKLIDLDVKLEWKGETPYISVVSNKETFGSQPFLSIKTWDKRYLTDNFDLQEPRRRWTYTLDKQTIPLKAIECIGVASNAHNGSCCVILTDANGKLIDKRKYP
jgi:hypothetical protein